MTAPKAACSPVSVSPSDTLVRTGGRSAYLQADKVQLVIVCVHRLDGKA